MKQVRPSSSVGSAEWHAFDRTLAQVRAATETVLDGELESLIDQAVARTR